MLIEKCCSLGALHERLSFSQGIQNFFQLRAVPIRILAIAGDCAQK
jgi:hypothetical protein